MTENKYMDVRVNDEIQKRKIVGCKSDLDLYGPPMGLYPRPPELFPVPETFEGEVLYWIVDGSCFIKGPFV